MDKITKILFGKEAREKILKAINLCYDAVAPSLGPEGGAALMYRTYARGPRIVDDGATIIRVLEPKDEFEKIALETFRESVEKTNEKAGDGTATTTVIAATLARDIFAKLDGSTIGGGSMGVRKLSAKLKEEAKVVIEKIKERSKKTETLEELQSIARIAVADPELGNVIGEMAWAVGADGFLDVVEGYKGDIEREIIKGMRFPAKIPAKGFINHPQRFEMIAKDVAVVITNFTLDNPKAMSKWLNPILAKNPKIVIFAPDFSSSVLTDLYVAVYNTDPKAGVRVRRGELDIYPIKCPSLRTEQFEDLAVVTDASFFNKERGMKLENIEEKDLGFAEKIIIKDVEAREDAIIIGGRGSVDREVKVGNNFMPTMSKVAAHLETLKGQLEETRQDAYKKLLQRRIASVSSAVGIIRVGAISSAELLPKKLKIEDAVYACKAALQEGHVRGGGLCLKEIADELPENMLTHALRSPHEVIKENCEGELSIDDTIIDPAKVVRLAVEHAVSVVSSLITVKMLIPEQRDRSVVEGYEDIAKAINNYTSFWARKEGLIKENEMEMAKDNISEYQRQQLLDDG
jgi:chaperonin GroEL